MMRNGFNLLMALFMILILGGAAVLTMKYVSISARHTADSYVREQAEIFARSVLEATILKMEGFDRSSGDCLKTLSFQSPDGKFDAAVAVTRYYLYKGVDNDGSTLASCKDSGGNTLVTSIQTPESHGYAMIEIVVTTNKNNEKIGDFVNPVRITLRSLQHP